MGAPTVAPTPSPTTPATTPAPTPAPTAAPTVAPTPSPTTTAPASSSCVDIQGTVCNHCIASNNVCYAQPKSWCDTFSYTWCGSTSLLQQDASPALRRKARTQGFLAPSFP